MSRLTAALSSAALCFALVPQVSFSAAQSTITIEQMTAKDQGSWVLLWGNNSTKRSTDDGVDEKNATFTLNESGQMVLSITPPAGGTARLLVYNNGTLKESLDTQQYAFTLNPGDDFRFIIQYAITKFGTLGVTSQPSGVPFRMVGPNGKKYIATTPYTFKNLPAARYTITPSIIENCYLTRPVNALAKAGERVAVNFTVTCKTDLADQDLDRSRPSKRALQQSVLSREKKYFNSPSN